jgi:hypothetical protein
MNSGASRTRMTLSAAGGWSAALILGLCSLVGCKTKSTEAATVGPTEPARRAALSFVHCVESDGGGCVQPDEKHGAWDAFALLHWMGSGSPVSILQALRRELDHHRDPYAIQDRFVALAARYREPLRGAECRPDAAAPVEDLLPTLVKRVETRLTNLGLWRSDLEGVVTNLAKEARKGLDEGWLVHVVCEGDPYEVWIATAKEDERQVVVGMLTTLPVWLGGAELSEDQLEGRIRGLDGPTSLGVVREGVVDSTWVPIAIEEF